MRFDKTNDPSAPPLGPGALALAALLRTFQAVLKCRRAAVAPLTALMLVPICGAIAYSIELGSWQYMQRSMQNAADSAAIAAATNNQTTGVSTYLVEARAAAKQFGFVDGVNDTTVTAAPATCPTGTATGATCYSATISTKFPLFFSGVVGFSGDTTYGSGRGQTITSYAIATTAGGGTSSTTQGCYYAMSTDPQALQGNGIPFANLSGCSVFSNGGISCNGNNMGADYAIAALSTSLPNCAATSAGDISGGTLPAIPYASAPYTTNATNAASSSCGSNPTKGSLSATLLVYCGNVTLTGDLTLTSKNTVVVIENGTLDLNKNTLSTGSGASATIIFSSSSAVLAKNMQGTFNIQAPNDSSSPWEGVAMYRAPGGANAAVSLSGSQVTSNISGAVYLPQVNVTINGVVNKSAYGATCFVLYANTITINGNGTILNSTTGCASAGTTVPTAVVGGGTTTREKLVL